MSGLYTDDDVKAAAVVVKVALDYRYPDPADIAASVLHVVGASLAARALREAAVALLASEPTRSTTAHVQFFARELRARADDIEGGAL